MEALKKWIETIRTMHATLVEKHGVFPMLLFYVTVIAAGIGTVNSVRLRQSQHEVTRLTAERHLLTKGLADTLTLAAKEMASKTATLDAVNTRAAMQRLEAHQNEYASRLNAVVTQVSVLLMAGCGKSQTPPPQSPLAETTNESKDIEPAKPKPPPKLPDMRP